MQRENKFLMKTLYQKKIVDQQKYKDVKLFELGEDSKKLEKNLLIPFNYEGLTFYARVIINAKIENIISLNDMIENNINDWIKKLKQEKIGTYSYAYQLNKKSLYEDGIIPHKVGIEMREYIEQYNNNDKKWDKGVFFEHIKVKNIVQYVKDKI